MKQETAKATETTKKKGGWIKADREVIEDTSLCKTAINVYETLKGIADFETGITLSISYAKIAEKIGRKARTAYTHVKTLVDKGIIIVIPNFKIRKGRKVYDENQYLVVGGNAPCYQKPENSAQSCATLTSPLEEQNEKLQKGYAINCELNTQIDSPDLKTKEPKETNTTWEAETSSVVFSTPSYVEPEALSEAPKVSEANLNETDCKKMEVQSPKQKTISKARSTKKPEMDVSNVPDNLKPTARLLLGLSERTKLKEDEVKLLVLLLEKHFPARIQGEIERQAERFKKEGRNMHSLQVFLLYEILKNQRSRPLDEPEAVPPEAAEVPQAEPITDPQTQAIYERVVPNPRRSNKRTAKRAPKTERKEQSTPAPVSQPVEFVMPVEDAEKVIAEYEAEHAKPSEPAPAIPVALEELFGKIQAKDEERFEEYCASLPQNEYGEPVFPEGLDEDKCKITLEEYLRLKYPEAEEEELCRDYSGQVYGSVNEHPELARLQAAFDIDYVCAMCITPGDCKYIGQPKPEAKMFTGKDGKRFLGTGFEGCIKCKHVIPAEKTPEEKHREAEFALMMHRSGITTSQRGKTFESLKPETPEVMVAKAAAILAAKTGRNLVLAGNAGTGKTHLALAIAIDAMKAGRQARVITACEMLDEICQANRDNTDPFGAILKYKSVPVLVIDDWDKARMTEARFDYLYQIINYRYERGLQTIVTTNAYNLVGLEHQYFAGKIEPIMTRLLENGDWVTIREAENYRLKPKPVTPAPVVEPKEARVGKISLTDDDDEMEAAALAEFAEMEAEMQSPEYQMAEKAQAEIEAEYCATAEPETTDTPKENTGVEEHEQLMFDFEFDEPVNPTEPKTADAPEEQTVNLPEKLPETEPQSESGGLTILSDEDLPPVSDEEWEEFCAKQRQEERERQKRNYEDFKARKAQNEPEPAMPAEEVQEAPAEEATKAPEPEPQTRSWQEIEQSAEYQALSESDKLMKQWEYFKRTPDYKDMWFREQLAVQRDFARRIQEAKLRECSVSEPKAEECPEPKKQSCCEELSKGIVIYVPRHDDGLDDDDDLTLYGDGRSWRR